MSEREKIVEVMARAIAADTARLLNAAFTSKAETGVWDFDPVAITVLSALEAAGYVVVPREPTEAMLRAQITKRDWNGVSGQERAAAIYRAMLAAAKPMED